MNLDEPFLALIMFTLYYTLIQPYYDYRNILWSSSSCVLLHKLMVTLRKTIRVVCKLKCNTNHANMDSIMKEHNLLNIKE